MSVIGIDFGTTNSSMARSGTEGGRADLIRDAEGNDQTPSVVYFGDEETIVGTEAVNLLLDARGDENVQAQVIRSVKRQLLTPPRIALPGGRTVRPVDVAAEILRKLKRDAEAGNPEAPLHRAIVTYPAVFDSAQTAVIVEAATLAGFEEVELLEEPVAAAIAFEHEGGQVGQGVLVYDYGGGTFDAAFIVRSEGEDRFYLALEPDGDARCGGDDIDRALYDYFDEQARRELRRPITLRENAIDPDFLQTCRRRKESLSKSRQVTFSTMLDGGVRFSSVIDRATFEQLIASEVERTVRITERTAARAREAGYPVDTVLLVGGSSQLPLVQQRIAETLGLKAQTWGHRDVAVALGAAYHAGAVWGRAVRRSTVQDPGQRYLRSVQLVWSDGRLDAAEIERLESVRRELHLSPEDAAKIERDVIGRAKDEFLAPGPTGSHVADEAASSSQSPVPPTDQSTAVANLSRRAEAHCAGRRFDEALMAINRALELDRFSAEGYALRGHVHLSLHQYENALNDFGQALDLDARLFPALIGRARVNTARHRISASFADLNHALQLDVHSSEAYEARGWTHLKAESAGAALADFDRAIEIDRASAGALAGRGQAKASLNRTKEANADFEEARALDARCVPALLGKAIMRVKGDGEPGEDEEPGELVEQVLGIDPDNPDALLLSGIIQLARQHTHAAQGLLHRALTVNADNVAALQLLALVLVSRGQAKEAIGHTDHALRLDPPRADLHAIRGWAHVELKRYDTAIEDLDQAVREGAQPSDRVVSLDEVYRLRGKAKLELQQWDGALADLSRALTLNSKSVAALLNRAMTYFGMALVEPAFVDARAAARLDPISEEARALQAAMLVTVVQVQSIGREQPPRLDETSVAAPKGHFAWVPQGVERLRLNQHLILTSAFENRWIDDQRTAIANVLNSTEALIWLCRCARLQDFLRQVALVVTSERLIWCRRTAFRSPEWGCVDYAAISGFGREPQGFTIRAPNAQIDIGFKEIEGGVDLSGLGLSLDGTDVGLLIASLLDHYRATDS